MLAAWWNALLTQRVYLSTVDRSLRATLANARGSVAPSGREWAGGPAVDPSPIFRSVAQDAQIASRRQFELDPLSALLHIQIGPVQCDCGVSGKQHIPPHRSGAEREPVKFFQ